MQSAARARPPPRESHRTGLGDEGEPGDQPDAHEYRNADESIARATTHMDQLRQGAFLPASTSRSTGSRRSAMPVAAYRALRNAGGPAVVPVSPMPPGGSPLAIR